MHVGDAPEIELTEELEANELSHTRCTGSAPVKSWTTQVVVAALVEVHLFVSPACTLNCEMREAKDASNKVVQRVP